MPTKRIMSRALASASALGMSGLCTRSPSAICLPQSMTGLSDVMGSWKIIEISLPR